MRELENVLRAAALFAEGDSIEAHDLHANLSGVSSGAVSDSMRTPSVAHERSRDVRSLAPADEPSHGRRAPSSAPTPNDTLRDPALPGEIHWDFADGAGPSSGPPASGTSLAINDIAMSQTSKIAQLGPTEGGTATEVAYAAIRAGISLSELKRDIERDCIARALAETGGNITRAAGLLGMKRPRLSQLVKQYGFGSSSAPPEDGAEDDE